MGRKLFLLILIVITGCTGTTVKKDDPDKTPDNYNLKIVIFNNEIKNPSEDNRCYYRIYINKVESGRTNTGLESQEKIFESKLSYGRHLFSIEKWVLDTKKGVYRKVNNVKQPKPSFYYFKVPKNKILKVTVKNTKSGRARYTEGIEKQ